MEVGGRRARGEEGKGIVSRVEPPAIRVLLGVARQYSSASRPCTFPRHVSCSARRSGGAKGVKDLRNIELRVGNVHCLIRRAMCQALVERS